MLIRYKFEDSFQNVKFITQLERNLTCLDICLDYIFFTKRSNVGIPTPMLLNSKQILKFIVYDAQCMCYPRGWTWDLRYLFAANLSLVLLSFFVALWMMLHY